MERRAIEWLLKEELIDPVEGEAALAQLTDPEPEELSGHFDPVAIAEAAAADLKKLYGARLRQVILFGSWARGDAHPESDIDLLVVLDTVTSPFEETRRMDEVLWNHSVANRTVLSALAVAEEETEHPARPVVINVLREGRRVA
ncbi:MAG: nucleotidyltransferase domain-containing protein [Actinobacteria bacterium]|nr:nucleotidyltransferase domain-containing protein [Actinomycetota bacterium]